MSDYAELHCLSNFSFLRGASHAAELVTRAHELGYRALALTDECSLAGVVRAHEALATLPAGHGFRLIVGAEFRCEDGLHLVLLAPTQRGYSQVCRLITLARRRAPKGRYTLRRADLEEGLEHCLALWIPPAPVPARRAANGDAGIADGPANPSGRAELNPAEGGG